MRIDHENGTVTDTLGDIDAVAGGFDMDSVSVLQDILSNVYNRTREAVLREYVTNALDSHAKAGTDRPVEVTLPDELDPVLKVVDHGVGLTGKEALALFGDYARSTKRGSNTEAGFFGIGSKVGYTETSQFTVTAVKDGLKNVILFSLGDDGASQSQPVAVDLPTTEGDGVTVEVPFRGHDGVTRLAESTYSTLPSGSVLVNGQPNVCMFDDALLTFDHGFVVGRERYSDLPRVRVVMGGVAYSINTEWTKRVKDAAPLPYSDLYLVADMGEVRPLPNREALRDCEQNRVWLERQISTLSHRIAQGTQERLSSHESAIEAAAALTRHRSLSKVREFCWRGRTYLTRPPAQGRVFQIKERGVSWCSVEVERVLDPVEMAGSKIGYVLAPGGLGSRTGLARFAGSRDWEWVVAVDTPRGEADWLTWGQDVAPTPIERVRAESKKVANRPGTPSASRTFRVWLPGQESLCLMTREQITQQSAAYGHRVGFLESYQYGWQVEAMLAGFPVVVQDQRRRPAKAWADGGVTPTAVPSVPRRPEDLTGDRRAVLDGILSTYTQREIDASVLLSDWTVRSHRDSLSVTDPRVMAALTAPKPDKDSALSALAQRCDMDLWCSFGDDYPLLMSGRWLWDLGDLARYLDDMYELKVLRQTAGQACA